MNKKYLLLIVVLLSIVLSGAAQAQEARTITIGLSWNERIQSLVQAWQDYMQAYANEFGAKWNVTFEWVVNVADSDPVRQNSNIQDLITQGVDVIVARPADSEAIGAAITAAQEAGIPFITFDRRSSSVQPTSHVGADSLNQAISTGEAFAALLAENGVQGQCIELQGDLVDTNAVFRSQGWNQVAASSGQYSNLVQVPTEWNPELFRSGLANALAAYPEANCIFVASDFAFNSVRAALEEVNRYFPAGEEGHVWIAAQDVNPQGYEAMLGGYIDVATTYDAYFHSVELVNVAVRAATGDIVQPQYLVPGRVATPALLPDMEFIWARDYSD
jgi:ABC-type sugar transport system substrate-binding protein